MQSFDRISKHSLQWQVVLPLIAAAIVAGIGAIWWTSGALSPYLGPLSLSLTAFGVACYVVVSRLVVRPLREMVCAIASRGRDDDLITIPKHLRGEIGELANALGGMLRTKAHREQQGIDLQRALERSLNELAESNRELEFRQFALDQAAIVDVTDLSGRIEYVNDHFCRVAGYSADELIGQDHRIVNSGHHSREFFQEMYRVISSGRVWRAEVKNRSKDGSYYWLDTTIVPNLDSRGKVSRFTAIRFDITARKTIEERLALANEAARAGMWDWDIETGTFITNEEFHRMLGQEPVRESWPIHWFFEQLHPDDFERTTIAVERSHNDSSCPYEVDFRLRCPGGNYRWIRSRGRVVDRDANGKPLRMIGQHVDISELKENERLLMEAKEVAEMASRSKSEFLANMSHEIRTPMTAILGYADLLLEGDNSETDRAQRKESVQIIKRNGEHLLSIINDILDLSKIEAGKMVIEEIDVAPIEIVNSVCQLHQPTAAGKNLELIARFEGGIPTKIKSDPVRLRQILLNLVGNALKFTEVGRVTITMSLDASNPIESMLNIVVADTGIGMTKEQLGRLFQAFSQADTSTTRRFGGTGLGLMISRRLACMLGGNLTVSSEPNRGSQFKLQICVGDANKVELSYPHEVHPSPVATKNDAANGVKGASPLLANRRILLAEDGPDNQRLIAHILRKAGAEVTVVGNGRLAVEQFTEDGTLAGGLKSTAPFDIVLMDMQMPEMDGYTAAGLLRDKGNTVPVIALTAHAMGGERDRCISSGCDDYATKPIDKAKFLTQLADWISKTQVSSIQPPTPPTPAFPHFPTLTVDAAVTAAG